MNKIIRQESNCGKPVRGDLMQAGYEERS